MNVKLYNGSPSISMAILTNNGTVIFSDEEKLKIRKEFIALSTNRREFLSEVNKYKAEEKYCQDSSGHPTITAKRTSPNGRKPVYECLLQKGVEYEMKNQIKRDLEQNIDIEKYSFRPNLNPKSEELAKFSNNKPAYKRLYDSVNHSRA